LPAISAQAGAPDEPAQECAHTPHSRLLMVRRMLEHQQPATSVAADFGVSERTVRKWLARWRAGGEPALNDRSSAPARQRRLPPEQVAAIEALRRQRRTSPVIARRLGLPLSTARTGRALSTPTSR